MYNLTNLTLKRINSFRKINQYNTYFNLSNKNFFEEYDNSNIIQKIFLRKNVNLLYEERGAKLEHNYIGYIWFEKHSKYYSSINSINVIGDNDLVNCYKALISSLASNSLITYECERNDVNADILSKLEFKKTKGIMELEKQCMGYQKVSVHKDVTFSIIEKNKDEELRCNLQNEIFKNNNRIPISIEDIYYDEAQEYYFDNGSIFINLCGIPIGYGQVIVEDNCANIVNFGIIEKYRKEGYGKLLLSYLLNLIMDNDFKKVALKVDSNNIPALNLYLSLGFIIKRELYTFEKTKV
jgi:GNAT superfamily N-acetyltransferase